MEKIRKKIIILLILLFIVALNVFLVWPLFQGEYDKNLASIGVAHILNARYLLRFWNYGWNPFWYGGFPNHLIYPLLAPISLAVFQKIFSIFSMAQVYRIAVGAAYVLTPVSLFYLTRYLTGKNLAGFLAALIYLLAPSANYFLIPGFLEIGETLHFAPWQLSIIVDYGEGPHIIALALVPFAVIAFWKLLRDPSFYKFIGTAVLIGLIVSINLFSAYALAYFLLGVFLSEIVLGKASEKFRLSVFLIPVVYGLIAFCYDISMLSSLAKSGYIHPENTFHLPPITTLFLIVIFGLLPLSAVIYELFKNRSKLQNSLVLGIWFVIFWAIPYAFYKGFWFGSQPNRYMPELNMAVAVIGAVVFVKIYDFIKAKLGKLGIISNFLVLLFVGFLVYASQGFIQNGWDIVASNPDIKVTSEYKIAKWLEKHIDYSKGERAYLSGSPAFFLNEFADVPQIRGDEDNAQANHWWADVTYQVNTGEDGVLATGWLEAYNVKYIVVAFNAITPYNDFRNQEKFLNLPKVSEIDGFHIFEIPGSGSIVQVVDLEKLARAKPLSHESGNPVLDREGLLAYLKAINEPTGANIEYSYPYRTNPDLVEIKVSGASEKTGILFKSTYDRGWRARVKMVGTTKEKRVKISKIGPDLMLVKPDTKGDYSLELSYHRPLVEYLGYLATFVTVVVLIVIAIRKRDFKITYKESDDEKIH